MSHVAFEALDRLSRGDISPPDAVRDLEFFDPVFEHVVHASRPGQKFSWLVLGEFYRICDRTGLVYGHERGENDWSRWHFDRSPQYRMVAVANILSQLVNRGERMHSSGRSIEERMRQLEEENAALRARVQQLEEFLREDDQIIVHLDQQMRMLLGMRPGDIAFGAIW